ncbi:hypothetical protein PENTCL1PPCAC_28689, partial [Pristionchus entomophagus]
ITDAATCYMSATPSVPYNVLEIVTVESQRGCEVQCDAKTPCAGFSFNDAGASSSCVLLSTTIPNGKCAVSTTILLKTTMGCLLRTNITSELGVDPCIDAMVPLVRVGNSGPICPIDNTKNYVIRAVDADGSRITLDNDIYNWMEKSENMWVYRFGKNATMGASIPIVAATCAVAAGSKCPCAP